MAYNGVGARTTTKGGNGISGFVSKNRAYVAIRRQYDFAPPSNDYRSRETNNDPSEVALNVGRRVLSGKELERSVRSLEEHNALRRIKIEVEELRDTLTKRGDLASAAVLEQVNQFHKAKLRQFLTKAGDGLSPTDGIGEKRGRQSDDDQAGPVRKAAGKSAASFASAFGVVTDEPVADGEAPHQGAAFDRATREAAKDQRVQQQRLFREQQESKRVQSRVLAAAAAAAT